MLATTMDAEVAEWIDSHAPWTYDASHCQVVYNGYHGKRKLTTGLGQLEIQQRQIEQGACRESLTKAGSGALDPSRKH